MYTYSLGFCTICTFPLYIELSYVRTVPLQLPIYKPAAIDRNSDPVGPDVNLHRLGVRAALTSEVMVLAPTGTDCCLVNSAGATAHAEKKRENET